MIRGWACHETRFSLEVDGFLSHVCHLCVGAHLWCRTCASRKEMALLYCLVSVRSHLKAQSSYPALRAERVTCTWPHALTRPSHIASLCASHTVPIAYARSSTPKAPPSTHPHAAQLPVAREAVPLTRSSTRWWSLPLPSEKTEATHAISKLIVLRSTCDRLRGPRGEVSKLVVVGANASKPRVAAAAAGCRG
jgi:hypothetical protein